MIDVSNKVAIFVADGTEPAEAVVPADILSRGGVDVTFVSAMPTVSVALAQGVHIEADIILDELEPSNYDLLVVPGGSEGVARLGKCQKMIDALAKFIVDSTKFVGSICAGPTILANNALLEGRRATCYPGCEDGFPAGVYQSGVDVVVDGNLITATGPGTAYAFGLALLAALKGDAASQQVASGMLIK